MGARISTSTFDRLSMVKYAHQVCLHLEWAGLYQDLQCIETSVALIKKLIHLNALPAQLNQIEHYLEFLQSQRTLPLSSSQLYTIARDWHDYIVSMENEKTSQDHDSETLNILVLGSLRGQVNRIPSLLSDETRRIHIHNSSSGYEALGKLIHGDIDVFICESTPSDIDGRDLVKLITTSDISNPYLKIMLILDEQQKKTSDFIGYPDFILRHGPGLMNEVKGSLEVLLQKRALPASSRQSQGKPKENLNEIPELKRILCIDDDRLIQVLVKNALRSLDLKSFDKAMTGQEGIDLALKSPPDLIILDYMLPDFDGPVVFRKLGSLAATKGIPIIFLTGKSDQLVHKNLLKMGAISVIQKPFNPNALASTIKCCWESYFEAYILRSSKIA